MGFKGRRTKGPNHDDDDGELSEEYVLMTPTFDIDLAAKQDIYILLSDHSCFIPWLALLTYPLRRSPEMQQYTLNNRRTSLNASASASTTVTMSKGDSNRHTSMSSPGPAEDGGEGARGDRRTNNNRRSTIKLRGSASESAMNLDTVDADASSPMTSPGTGPSKRQSMRGSVDAAGSTGANRRASLNVRGSGKFIIEGGGNGNVSRRRLFDNMSFSEIASMSRSEVAELWTVLDVNRDGSLEKSELRALARDMSETIARHVEKTIREQMPHLSDASVKSTVDKEMMFLLPTKPGKDSDVHRDLAAYLMKKLDIDGDGTCSRSEFFARWNSVAREVFKAAEEDNKDNSACAIM